MALAWGIVASTFFISFLPTLASIGSNWRWIKKCRSRRIIAVEDFRIRAGQVEAIAAIERSPLRRRLEREGGIDRVAAEIAIDEYLAFLAIAAANPNRMVAPTSGPCDEAWHAHILHTEAYDRDMRAIFGGPFHHRPADDPEEAWLEEPQRRTEAMLERFGGISSWPGLNRARAERNVPNEMVLSTAAMLGMAIAEGPESLEKLAASYRPLRASAQGRRHGGGCGGGSCGGHSGGDSCGGHSGSHSCGGHSGGGHSCGGSSCGGSSCGGH